MPPKAPLPRYERLEVRLASFDPPNVSNKGPLAASQARRGAKSKAWPHPLTESFNPTSLSKAGYYFNPSPDQPDNCTCFVCGKSLGGWESGDSPSLEHVNHDEDDCGWARAVCEVESKERVNDHTYMFESTDRLPTSKAMEILRHDTFSVWWPHDDVPKHSASSKKMAKAGFHCTPSSDEPDNASCVYCGASLSAWEPMDDPLAEHRRKRPNCVFFTAGDRVGVDISMLSVSVHASPKRKVNGKGKTLAKSSSSQGLDSQHSKSLSSGNIPSATDSEIDPPPLRRTLRGGNVESGSRAVATSHEEASASEVDTAPPMPTAKGKTKGKTAKVAVTQQTSTSTSEPGSIQTEPAKKKRGRPPKKTVPIPEPQPEPAPQIVEETEPEPEPQPAAPVKPAEPKKRGRAKKVKPEPEEPVVVLSDDDGATTKPPPRARKAKGKGKEIPALSQPSASDSQEQPEPARVTRSASKQPTPSESEDATDAEPPSRRTRAASAQPDAPPPEALDVEMQDAMSSESVDKIEAEPMSSDIGDDEASDVEEVERTVLGPSQPTFERVSPVTPPPISSAPPILPGPSLSIPAMQPVLPLPPISNFTEGELSMTLEEWVRHETRRQYEVLRAEGERRIAEFTEKARIIRAKIEAL
ncbi:BIR-domain-containing protein [Calocera viscosa TUFC12733]|uniref:BIR-domain-containing protein n=1 Tax=Calocera viscosa (strain TUFC12733) TaxID=1330018 RepID=A0A167P8F4_CALVF|nr:BIR-domain-containing protein [Calocera viscosa TUFC12733]